MKRQVATIAYYTLLEALRTRLPVMVLACLAVLLLASLFVREIAITESARMQTAFLAAAARIASVFVVSLYVLAAVAREFNDKGVELLLSLDLPRAHYILGKLAGFVLVAVLVTGLVTLCLIWFAPPAAVLAWAASLALELSLVAALSLFCIVTFNQVVPAASFVMAFYLLARSLTAIRLISANPISGAETPAHQVIGWTVDGLALVMPALDAFTQTAWLVNPPAGPPPLAALAWQSAVYFVLLAAVAMFDFYRKEF